ncbi:hypothetical protein KR52_09345 [Synechococcus sp. KORDI-52]|uniref:hypothetical protein n=1 Tax=Synechococcus sp. KORDI-52 TaxID=585425 RepID=UPI0004E03753|nr:hypothetical protein [Synechococcus sp. KORDI-52]AII49346.1 hypothetical protein KR52_09345 [Synechococcus sp. KORDI-52]
MDLADWFRLRIFLFVAGFVVLCIVSLSPWNIEWMSNDTQQQVEEQLEQERQP